MKKIYIKIQTIEVSQRDQNNEKFIQTICNKIKMKPNKEIIYKTYIDNLNNFFIDLNKN